MPTEDTSRHSSQAVADGNGNGKVGIEDVTQIAMNFGANVHHYAVESVDDYELPFTETAQTPLSSLSRTGRLQLIYTAGLTPAKYYRVVPVDADGARGIPSNVVSTASGDAPQIVSVTPSSSDSGTQATFTATVTGDGPFEYAWDFGGGAAPGTSGDVSPTVTLSNGGTLPQPIRTYQANLAISSPFGSVSYPFNLDVSAGWHVEEIPKVPGYDVIAGATYFYGPDGSLWGMQSYSSPLADNFLVRIVDGEMVEYEKVDGTPAVDRENNPARVYRVKTGFMSYDYYYSRRTNGQWSDGELIEGGVTSIKPEVFFTSDNKPVIVYSKGAGANSAELWIAQREVIGMWTKTLVQEAGVSLYYLARMNCDDTLLILYSINNSLSYATIAAGDLHTESLYSGYENSIEELSYFIAGFALNSLGDPYILAGHTRHDKTQSTNSYSSSVLGGKDEGGGWDWDILSSSIANAPEYIRWSGRQVVLPGNIPVVVTCSGSEDRFQLYISEDGVWSCIQDFLWQLGSWELSVDTEGCVAIITQTELYTFR